MSIQESVQLVIKMHNLTPASFADEIGVQRSNISHILSGRNKPSLDMLEKIVLSFHRVNAHWLITGLMLDNDESIKIDPEEKKPEIENVDLFIHKIEATHSAERGEIEKIVTFYIDGTFGEHFPRK